MTRFSEDWYSKRQADIAAKLRADIDKYHADNFEFVNMTGMGPSRIPAPGQAWSAGFVACSRTATVCYGVPTAMVSR